MMARAVPHARTPGHLRRGLLRMAAAGEGVGFTLGVAAWIPFIADARIPGTASARCQATSHGEHALRC